VAWFSPGGLLIFDATYHCGGKSNPPIPSSREGQYSDFAKPGFSGVVYHESCLRFMEHGRTNYKVAVSGGRARPIPKPLRLAMRTDRDAALSPAR